MEIILQRKQKKPECVQGKFVARHGGEEMRGYTLEPPDMDNEKNASCILPGKYQARVEYSGTYNCKIIRLEDKNNRANVLWHPGNKPHETRGCIFPGAEIGQCAVWESRKKLVELIEFIENSGTKKFPVEVREPEV